METIFFTLLIGILLFIVGKILEDKLTSIEERLKDIENKLNKK